MTLCLFVVHEHGVFDLRP